MDNDRQGALSALVGLDANALDPNPKRDEAIARFMALASAGRLNIVLGNGVRAELMRADPAGISGTILALARHAPAPGRPLSAAQHIARIRVRAILSGNARPEKHAADALHVSEAAEAECTYFVTYDSRILRKRADLEALAVPNMKIVTLEDLLALGERFQGQCDPSDE